MNRRRNARGRNDDVSLSSGGPQPFARVWRPSESPRLVAFDPLTRQSHVIVDGDAPATRHASPHDQSGEITLTAEPARVTATGAQELRLARDVAHADELCLLLRVYALTATSVTIELMTGMQRDTSEGWVSAGSFSAVSSVPSAEVVAFTGLLRYVRYNVSSLGGAGGEAIFSIDGRARRWSKR